MRDYKQIQYCPRCGWGMYLVPGYYWRCGNRECSYIEDQDD